MGSANDNGTTNDAEPPISVSPKQARELARICKLAAELLDAARRLEQDLVTADTKKRIMATATPTPAMVARMADLMRRKGV